MSIVCGTDLSEASTHAVAAAAQLARGMHLPLHVVYSLEIGQGDLLDEPRSALSAWVTEALNREAERLRRTGLTVDTHVRSPPADEAVFEVAKQADARLIVVAASSQRHGGKGQLGSRADRIAHQASIPVLAVRDSKPFEAWGRGERPLRVVLAADLSLSTEAAMRWLAAFSGVGACEIVLVHLYWPPQQFQRLGLSGVRSFLDPDVEVTSNLKREFSERLAAFAGLGSVKLRLEPNLGRLDARIATLALEENADLVVVGSHGRNAPERLWEGSVCRGVLRMAYSSVACIPRLLAEPVARRSELANVLVATDFSDVGNAAISLAYAVTPASGSVHLVHVIPAPGDGFEPRDIFEVRPANAAAHAEAEARLRSLILPVAEDGGPRTMVHVLSSGHPSDAIAQAAERLHADLICLGTHGRTGVTRALLGSVAQSVLGNTQRPVLLARAPQP